MEFGTVGFEPTRDFFQDVGCTTVTKRDGRVVAFIIQKIRDALSYACRGYNEQEASVDLLTKEVLKALYDGAPTTDISRAMILAAAACIERDPAYNHVAARLYMQQIYKELAGKSVTSTHNRWYLDSFKKSILTGVELGLLAPRMAQFDLELLARAIVPERDELLGYVGIQTLYERYFLKSNGVKLELPQTFFMRVAMGLAQLESEPERWAIEFYTLLSSLRYLPSTPTLFHAGLVRAQLSSCYLSTVKDDLHHIFKCIGDNAQLSKWAGGLGNDWTNIRGTGSFIKSINATSQGVVPFLKIANDVVVGITRSGIRRGGACAYLETWHLDIEDFLDLRRNTGDERRRTHDMSTANWIPDLFMERVMSNQDWTLFSPDETPDLHEIYGKQFKHRYEEYEALARAGKIRNFKIISAAKLWKKMLSRLFETGHPWITFKDPCNIRSPQDHVGVIHSSNLCTEITLNTSETETAVCNLGSVNLERHVHNGIFDQELLAQTVKTAIRMLDNVIDLNFYPTVEAENSNKLHRPVGLGVMGFQDALFKLDILFDAPEAREFADRTQELISFSAIQESTDLARIRGAYRSYKGSKWDRGILPHDTIALVEQERGSALPIRPTERLAWDAVRAHIKQYGMRNSNLMAVAPTATIANIAGCYPCIEPLYRNIYVKSNISGEFTIVNKYLVADLKKINLWNSHILDKIKYADGQLEFVPEIPETLQKKYRGAFELDPEILIEVTAARGMWIDQSQSHNIFMKGVSGKKLNDIYIKAWQYGLKTTYYLRTLGATQIEKSTLDAKKFGYTQKREYGIGEQVPAPTVIAACAIDNPDCESCQ